MIIFGALAASPAPIVVMTSPDYWMDIATTVSVLVAGAALFIAFRSFRSTNRQAVEANRQADKTLDESRKQFQAALQVAQEANAVSLQTIEEMRKAQDQYSAPYLIAYVEFTEPSILLVIKNVGKSIATNIKLSVDPPFAVTPSGYDLNKMSFLIDGIAALAPGQEWRTIYAPFREYLDNPPKNPRKYKMTIKFQGGITSNERTNIMFLDIAAIEGTALHVGKDLEDLVKEIESLRQIFETFIQIQAGGINVLKEGLWIKNSNLPAPPMRPAPGDQLAFISAQLQTFQSLWLHGYKRADFRINQNSAIGNLVDYRDPNTRNDCYRSAQQIIYALAQCQDTLPTQLAEEIAHIATSLLSLGNFMGEITPGKTRAEDFNENGEALLQKISAFRQLKDEYLGQLDQPQNENTSKNSINRLVDPASTLP